MWLTVALSLPVLCLPAAAQDSPQQTSPSSEGSSTSARPDGDSSGLDSQGATSKGSIDEEKRCDVSQLHSCLKDFLGDQAGIWTSPLRLHVQDAFWLLPLAGATAVSLHYDVQTMQQVSTSPTRIRISNDLSNAGAYGAIGAAGTTYLIGKFTHNERARETGVLSLEAIADAGLVTEVLKLATNRERPYTGTGRGRFWPDGTDDYTFGLSLRTCHHHLGLFTCGGHETPGHRWLHLGLYAIATGVSVARVTSRNHFPSDVVVGSAIGYLTGGYVAGSIQSFTTGATTSGLLRSPQFTIHSQDPTALV